MKDKCEWKPETRRNYSRRGLGFFACKGYEKKHGDETPNESWHFCPFCGADIRVSNLCTLYAVNGMEFPCVCYNHDSDEYDGYTKDECRLATVSDLEEVN